MKNAKSIQCVAWLALIAAAIAWAGPSAQAIKADGVELGTGGVYDGAVEIARDSQGRITFKDCEVTSAITLTSLTRSVAIMDHGRLEGLGMDDHLQYLTGARHGQSHVSADFNSTMPVTADVDGNTTLGGHLLDGDIHLNRTTQTLVSGDWIFGGALQIWNGMDFSASGSAGDAPLRFGNGMALFAGNSEVVTVTSSSNAATVTLNAGGAHVDFRHLLGGGGTALFVDGNDGRVAIGSNKTKDAGLRVKSQSDITGARPLWLDSYSATYPWTGAPLILSHSMGTEEIPSPPTGTIMDALLSFQLHNGTDYVTAAYIDVVTAGYSLGEPYLPGSLRVWTRAVASPDMQLRFAVGSDGQCSFFADSWVSPIYCGNGAFLSYDGYWSDASSRERKTHITPSDGKAAWDRMDQLTPVEFEFRKTKRQWRLADGRVVDSLAPEIARRQAELEADPKTRPEDRKQARALAEQMIKANSEPLTTILEEGTGLKRFGFIAEDLPVELSHGQPGVSAIEIASHNTTALKEAKRRILDLERRLSALEQKVNTK